MLRSIAKLLLFYLCLIWLVNNIWAQEPFDQSMPEDENMWLPGFGMGDMNFPGPGMGDMNMGFPWPGGMDKNMLFPTGPGFGNDMNFPGPGMWDMNMWLPGFGNDMNFPWPGGMDKNMLFPGWDLNEFMPPGAQNQFMKLDPILSDLLSAYEKGDDINKFAENYGLIIRDSKVKVDIILGKKDKQAVEKISKYVEEYKVDKNLDRISGYVKIDDLNKLQKEEEVLFIAAAQNQYIEPQNLGVAYKLSYPLSEILSAYKEKDQKLLDFLIKFYDINTKNELIKIQIISTGKVTMPKESEILKSEKSGGKNKTVAYFPIAKLEELAKQSPVEKILEVPNKRVEKTKKQALETQKSETKQGQGMLWLFLIGLILGLVAGAIVSMIIIKRRRAYY